MDERKNQRKKGKEKVTPKESWPSYQGGEEKTGGEALQGKLYTGRLQGGSPSIKDKNYSIAKTSLVINRVKNMVLCVAFIDWLKDLKEEPVLGSQQELPRAVEEALVEYLVMCSKFQYPWK